MHNTAIRTPRLAENSKDYSHSMTQANELCISFGACTNDKLLGRNIWTPSSFLLLGKKVEARLGRLEQQGKEGDNPQV
jgi:hypothetical protein